MSAWCELSIDIFGRNRKKCADEILKVLYLEEEINAEEGKDVFYCCEGKDYKTKKMVCRILTDNTKAHNLWGKNYLDIQNELPLKFAKASPEATWILDMRCQAQNGGDGCESYMICSYENRVLEVKMEKYIDTRALIQLIEEFDEEMSYETFCEHFVVDESLDAETFEESLYEDFYYNSSTKTVSSHHIWKTETYTID